MLDAKTRPMPCEGVFRSLQAGGRAPMGEQGAICTKRWVAHRNLYAPTASGYYPPLPQDGAQSRIIGELGNKAARV